MHNNRFIQQNTQNSNNALIRQQMNRKITNEERERLHNIEQQMNKIKLINDMKDKGDYAKIEKYLSSDNYKNSIIDTIKQEKPNPSEVISLANDVKINKYNDKYKQTEYWDNRTNIPYKSALKDVMEDTEYYKKNFSNTNDLIVHRNTEADKINLLKEYEEFQKSLEKHKGELKMTFSASAKAEHLKKFKYNNKSKFKIKYDPSDHDELKQEKLELYKQEQKKNLDKNKKFDLLLESAINSGVIDKDVIKKQINVQEDKDDVNEDDDDEDEEEIEKYKRRQKK